MGLEFGVDGIWVRLCKCTEGPLACTEATASQTYNSDAMHVEQSLHCCPPMSTHSELIQEGYYYKVGCMKC